MYADKDLNIVHDKQQYTASDGTQYPKNYPKDEIAELTKVIETSMPNLPDIKVTGWHLDENCTQVWDVLQKTEKESAEEANNEVLAEISRLEAEVTERRKREAILGNDNGWLAKQDFLIASERKKLKRT